MDIKTKRQETQFLGRQREITLLHEKNWRNHAQLIVVYGRRRVGKTALIEYAYRNQVFWKFEGLEGESTKKQIQNFISRLATYTQKPQLKENIYRNWDEVLEIFAQELKDKKLEVFFDEFQWLAEMGTGFVSLFKSYWDNHFKKNRHLRFILCGSISSFMVKKVLKSKALYGRVDTEINLKPLSLADCQKLLDAQASTTKRKPEEILQINMIFGGIPQYLEELNPKMSLMQNLNEYALKAQGYFFQEYGRLFISHFSDNPLYEKILLSLSQKTNTSEDLAKACEIKTGGALSEKLLDLELAGFIKRESPIHKGLKSKIVRYRLDDEYLHFYYQFILPNAKAILAGKMTMTSLIAGQAYSQWQGYAFERLCIKHAEYIATHLQFGGIDYTYGSWFGRGSENKKGTQIDLLFERMDKVLTLCEMKYVGQLNAKKIIEDFEKKISVISKEYPSYGIQKILVSGKKIKTSPSLQKYFDHILFAEDIFFNILTLH
ncbi:MAG: AAA family ATPase [Deltaproteobacteria bacterium]|nr:AAA family ATPase [Deltaproteobacteria bacterium]